MNAAVWILLCLIWGSTWLFIKIGLYDLPPVTFAVARFVLAELVLLPFVLIDKIPWPSSGKEWRLIVITGLLQFSVNYGMVFWSGQYISSGLAAVLQTMITVFGLPLAWVFLPAEKITKLKILAILVGVGGVAVIFLDQLRISDIMAFAGCVAIVIGAYAAAQASILVKAKGGGMQPATILFGQILCGLPPMLIYALVAEGDPTLVNWTPRAIACVVHLTLVGTIAAFWLYYWLLNRIESTRAMMISLVTPPIAVTIGYLALGEKLPSQTLIGAALILASIVMIVMPNRTSTATA